MLGGIYVADRNQADSRIDRYEGYSIDNGACFSVSTGTTVLMRDCHVDVGSMIESWRARKGWYEYAAGALVVLTLASAFAVSRRDRS